MPSVASWGCTPTVAKTVARVACGRGDDLPRAFVVGPDVDDSARPRPRGHGRGPRRRRGPAAGDSGCRSSAPQSRGRVDSARGHDIVLCQLDLGEQRRRGGDGRTWRDLVAAPARRRAEELVERRRRRREGTARSATRTPLMAPSATPSTVRARSGSVLASFHGSVALRYWFVACAPSIAVRSAARSSTPVELRSRGRRGRRRWSPSSARSSSVELARAPARAPSQVLWIIDSTRLTRLPQVATSSSLIRRAISSTEISVSACSGNAAARAYRSASGSKRSRPSSIVRPMPRLAEALPPLKVTYWLAGMSSGRCSGAPPMPSPTPSSCAGQNSAWNGMLSLPMK